MVLIALGILLGGVILGQEYYRGGALNVLYSEYYHLKMYEDGSFEGETINGTPVKGCIEGAMCND